MKKKIILLGSIPLATKILKLLLARPEIEVVGVVCEQKSREFFAHCESHEPCVYDFLATLDNKRIPIYTAQELVRAFKKQELYCAISARNPDILSQEVLDRFSKGVINCHGGPLPQFGGLNAANFAILQNQKKFAGTIHYMSHKIDGGPIIARKWFSVGEHDTAYDVFCKVNKALYGLIKENIDDIIHDKDVNRPHEFFINRGERPAYNNKHALERYRKVNPKLPLKDMYRIARAFTFPGHDLAYLSYGRKKIYLRVTDES